LKKPGQIVEGKEITVRDDTSRIDREVRVREVDDWACAIFTSHSVVYCGSAAYAENFLDLDGETWILILECRLERNSYQQSHHTLNRYTLKKNESELVENRSEDPSKVEVFAVWQFKKKFLNKQKDYKVLKEFLEKYITF